ncbi:hypothetical protein D3C87_1968010 [compost metagenome]
MPDYDAVVSFAAAIAQTTAAASVIELAQEKTFMTVSGEPKLILFVNAVSSTTASTARFANRTGRT